MSSIFPDNSDPHDNESLADVVYLPFADPDETPAVKRIKASIDAISFYHNSGVLIPGVHDTDAIAEVRDEIRPPHLKSAEDLKKGATRDYFYRFFELQVTIDAVSGSSSSHEDLFEAAQEIHKKTKTTATVLNLMLQPDKHKEIPAKAFDYATDVLQDLIKAIKSGNIKLREDES